MDFTKVYNKMLRICTWNLKCLGCNSKYFENVRAKIFANILKHKGLDIILFQEVVDQQYVVNIKNMMNKNNKKQYSTLPIKISGYRGFKGPKKLFPEHLSCIYDSNKFQVDNISLLNFLDFKATPVLYNFQFKFDKTKSVSLLNLHLPYISKKRARRKELSKLYKLLRKKDMDKIKLSNGEVQIDDLIIVGDLNFPGKFMFKRSNLPNMKGFKTTLYINKEKRFHKTNSSLKTDCCYDHIMYSRNNTTWKFNKLFIGKPESLILSPKKNPKFATDHLPVVGEFNLKV